jgi:hypothetical protein
MFHLTKVWVDNTPSTRTTEIRYIWTKLGGTPNWDGHEHAQLMQVVPNTNPPLRVAVLEIPRYVEDKPNYLLHYRFGGGGESRQGFNRDFTDEIVSREVEYVDHEGQVTEVRVLWGIGGWNAPNWSQAELQGLQLNPPNGAAASGPQGHGIADRAIYELVQTVPLPRHFVARIWAPKGTTVEYAFQLLRSNSPTPESDFVRWDNNQSQNYRVVL